MFLREGTGAVRVLEQILDLGVRLSLDEFPALAIPRSATEPHPLLLDQDRPQLRAQCRHGHARGDRDHPRAVVALAASLGMATTAEGVETEEELTMIRDLGCTKIQGYYFGRPLPVTEARTLVARTDRAARAA
ncbi:EAL domain-containing protein [Sphingomonas sp. MMS24-JH45]